MADASDSCTLAHCSATAASRPTYPFLSPASPEPPSAGAGFAPSFGLRCSPACCFQSPGFCSVLPCHESRWAILASCRGHGGTSANDALFRRPDRPRTAPHHRRRLPPSHADEAHGLRTAGICSAVISLSARKATWRVDPPVLQPGPHWIAARLQPVRLPLLQRAFAQGFFYRQLRRADAGMSPLSRIRMPSSSSDRSADADLSGDRHGRRCRRHAEEDLACNRCFRTPAIPRADGRPAVRRLRCLRAAVPGVGGRATWHLPRNRDSAAPRRHISPCSQRRLR